MNTIYKPKGKAAEYGEYALTIKELVDYLKDRRDTVIEDREGLVDFYNHFDKFNITKECEDYGVTLNEIDKCDIEKQKLSQFIERFEVLSKAIGGDL